MRSIPVWTAALLAGALPVAAQAQAAGPQLALEGTTDLRERGLSWSDGKAAAALSATIPATYDLSFDLAAMSLRDSARHGGADLGVRIAPRYRVEAAGWTFAAGVRGNVFVGRSGMSYVELAGEVERTIGPARLVAGAEFAPAQDAIGGHNLHVGVDGSVGVPGLPITVFAGLGHTSGSTRYEARAWRLRPGGNYTDHRVGVEYAMANLSAGVVYSGTSIDADAVDRRSPYYDRHHGARVLGYIRVSS